MDRKKYLSKENVEAIWELSLLQKEIFKKEDDILCMAFTIEGHPDLDKIQLAWQKTVQQTPLLRVVFRNARNRTVQVVLKEYPSRVEIVDGKENQDNWPSAVFSFDNQAKQFNLTEEAAVQMKLIRKTGNTAVFLLSCHRAILDKESLASVFADFNCRYFSLLDGGSIPLPQRTPFKKYLDWLAQQYWVPAIAHWKKELADFKSPTSLVQYQQYEKDTTHPYSFQQHILSRELSRDLENLAGVYGVSPAVVVQAAWAILLNLYSLETDVIFGVQLQGRSVGSESFENIIGTFANTLPLVITIKPHQQLHELMKEIHEKNERLSRYSFIPLEEIRSGSGLAPQSKLFESSVSVNMKNDGNGEQRENVNRQGTNPGETNGNIVLESVDSWQHRDHPFAVEVTTGEKWQMSLSCCEIKLTGTAALQVLKRLEAVLAEMQKNPNARLSQLDFLTAAEEDKLKEFNRSPLQLPPLCLEDFMHQVFERQVEKTPTAIACTWEEYQVSYGELNTRTNQWANWLREQGIGPNDLVGIFCERSIEMLIAVLAVFKAGGAYIPLNTNDPDSRVKTIIADSGAKVIFTRTPQVQRTLGLVEDLPFPPAVACLEPMPGEKNISNAGVLQHYPGDNLAIVNRPGDAAYVLFTSGSTGVPKGAVVEHIGMVNHLWTKIRLLQLSHTSKVVQNASHCFDISVWQFLAALVIGGQTVIYNNEVAMTPWLLLSALKKDRVTILEMVPAVIEMILDQSTDTGNSSETLLPDLKYMLSTGEALPTTLCQKWLEKYPHIPVVNAYGPTECSDDTHHRIISPSEPLEDYYNDVPLGRIIPNFRGYILDEAMRILPPGCVGEICLTGIGVGKGYLNNPERTADAFVKNPFPDGMGDPMYRTGDLGYFDIHGQLVFLGRIDHQVKVRGFRIELGEIETTIRKHTAVRQCVAVIRKDSTNQNSIIAYVVLNKPLSPGELRTYLEELLPHYMVPEHIMELEKLPLNRSGKIDRKALPDPDQMAQTTPQLELPQNQIEKTLVQIWEEVLEISPIGIDQNFFQLGGHSLKIIQIRSRINQLLGVDISIIELFRQQTVHQLARVIEEQFSDVAAPRKPPISKVPEAPYYPMSHAQQRLFFLYQIEPDNTAYNLPTSLEVRTRLDIEAFTRALQAVTQRQASLRTYFGVVDNNPVQYVADASDHEPWLRIEDLSGINADQREKRVVDHLKKETNSKFDLTKEPPFHTIVFKLEEEHYRLFFNMHHIIGDWWSWQIFFNEFVFLYQGYMESNQAALPGLDIQYVDYAAWQKQCIENGYFDRHADYWDRRFAGEIPVLELPLDFPRPLVQKYSSGVVSRNFPKNCVKPLYQLFQQKGVTPFIGLLSLFYAFLTRITGQEDIILGTPEAGRSQVEVENLIGFFVNTLPFRVNLGEDPTFFEVMDRVKQVSLEAYEHADYPLDLIINQLDLERDLGRYPLFSVVFQVNDEDLGEVNPDPNPVSSMNTAPAMNISSVPGNATNYDLEATFTETKNQDDLRCDFIYCKDLFKEETIERWMTHFITFFEAMIKSPQQKISTAPILTAQQKHQLLIRWNNTQAQYPGDQQVYLHRVFENQAGKTPDAAALAFRDQKITYRQLNFQANQLSFGLHEKGILPGSTVGLLVEHSLDMVVGIMGALKAGAVYIPLDPLAPVEAIKYRTADADLSLLVTGPLQKENIQKEFAGIEYLCLHDTGVMAYPGDNPANDPGFGSAAYIIYSPGFTDRPRGVQVSHSALTNLSYSMKKHILAEGDITLAITNYTVDIAFLELILPLTSKGQVVIAEKEGIHKIELLRDQLALVCPTIMQAAPGVWKLLLQSHWQGNPYLKCVVQGQVLSRELAAALVKKCHSLYHMYGPTETTSRASFYKIPPHAKSIFIGRPIENTRVYMLNPALSPVPIGVTGELYIGGEGLAHGYVNQPELTAQCFIPDPFQPRKTGKNRLFKTGDLARYLPDGNIQFSGRLDSQVTVRGFRVKLEEIESLLETHHGVKQAVVLDCKDSQGNSKLVSYLVKNEELADPKKEKTGKALSILGIALHSIDHFANIPIWKYSLPFLYLKAYLAKYPLFEDVLFETVDYYQNTPEERIHNDIINTQPDIILFSAYVWNIEKYKRLAKKIKEINSRIKIILGGPEVASDQINILKENQAFDIIVRGEGEKTFYQLIDAFLNHKDIAHVKGITYRNDGQILENEAQLPLSPDELPAVFENRIFDWKQLRLSIVALETQRGCNFSCGFCQYKKTRGIRYFPLSEVFKELEFIKNIGCDCLYLMDPTFNSDNNRAKEILRHIINLNMNVKVIAEMIPEYLDDELLELAARAGMVNLEIGVQSLNKNALKTMKRMQKLKDIETNIRLAYDKNINVIPQLIYGLPGDTLQEYCKSFDWLYMLDVDEIAAYHLLVLRGSQFYIDKDKHHLIYDANPPHRVISNATFGKEDVILAGKMSAAALSTQYTLRKTIKDYCINKGIKPSYFFLNELELENFDAQLADSFPIYNEKHLSIQLDCLKRIQKALTNNGHCTDDVEELINETKMLLVSRLNTIKVMSKKEHYNDKQSNGNIEEDIREFIKERLPNYKIPAFFIFPDKIPLTESGKIKRDALPVPIDLDKNLSIVHEQPRSEIEKSLSTVWEEVLGIKKIGVQDNFFQLGGHSIKGIKLISQLRTKNIHLTINELFLNQTIKEQAQYLLSTGKKDVHPAKTREEAQQMFKEEFQVKGEFVTYHIDSRIFQVFYPDVTDIQPIKYQHISRFFKDHLQANLCPHYIRPLSQKPKANQKDIHLNSREFAAALELKADDSTFPRQEEQTGSHIRKELAAFNQAIVNNKTVKQYHLSPMQKAHLTLENRFRDIRIVFDKYLDRHLLEEAFGELILQQGLLRSTLVKQDGELSWNELHAPHTITIPYVDLIDYSLEMKEKLISHILRHVVPGDFEENSLLYRVVLFRKDLKNHLLVIHLDHAIFDGMSVEIIKRNLLQSYRLKEKNQDSHQIQPAPKPYSDYIQLIARGPRDIDENQLVEFFALKEFSQYKKKFESMIIKGDSGKINHYVYELGFMEDMKEEKVWELSFILFNLFLKRYSGLSKIPVRIVSYGRRYSQTNFFDTVGEFIDLVPVLVRVNEKNPLNMVEDARNRLDKASQHNINFMSLINNTRLKEKWKKANQLLIPEQLAANDMMILFNFAGKAPEEEMNQRKQWATGTTRKESKICSFNAEIYYTSRALYFYISTSLTVSPGTFDTIKIAEEELKKIIKRSIGDEG